MSIESNIYRMFQFSEAEQADFTHEYNEVKKDTSTAVKMAVLGGIVGVHHFYLKRTWAGIAAILCVLTIIFFWVPLIEGWVEAFFLPQLVREYNEEQAVRIANSITLGRQLRNPGKIVESMAAVPGAPVERVIIKEVVKIPCKYCGSYVENTVSSCPHCGGSLN